MATVPYKNKRTARVATELVAFQKGMFYSNQIQEAGHAKMLVNYDLIDNGKALRTRKGVAVEYTGFNANIIAGEGLWIQLEQVLPISLVLKHRTKVWWNQCCRCCIRSGTPELEIFRAAGQEGNDYYNKYAGLI